MERKIGTTQLLHKLSQAKDINSFLSEYESEFLDISIQEFLNDILLQREQSIADIARQSGQGDYVYKIFNGERKASRNVLLGIAIGMQLRVEETQLLLRIARLATLDPRDKRDSIILYGIKEKHDISKLNDLLFELQEQTI